MHLLQTLYRWLRKLYNRYQEINWPDIPLSPLQWLLLLYMVFGIIYMSVTPIFEASDELWHFGTIEHIRETGELPVQNPEPDAPETIYRQEGSQPPLYYGLMALVTSPIDISDAEQYRLPNPHARAGDPGSYGNKNLVLHPVEGVPLSGTPLAVYVMRTLGLLMGLGTIYAVYQCGQLIAPHRPVVGLVAAAITAFNPMFIFISASVNNDTLVILLCSVAIWQMMLTLKHGFDTRRSLIIAVLIALGALTKLSALVLVPAIAFGGLWVAYRDNDWRGVFILGGAMLSIWLILSGWWYWRNIQLYGELFGTGTMAAVANRGIERSINAAQLLTEFQGFRFSYWGIFGAFNIQTSTLFYALADFFVFFSIIGVMFLIAQLLSIRDFSYARRELTQHLFLLGIVFTGLIAFISWTLQTPASQGRLLFPYMAAISPLLAVGFVEIVWWLMFLLSPPDRSFVRAGDAVPEPVLKQSLNWPLRIFGVLAFLIPLVTIAPQYTSPAPLDELPTGIKQVYARYDDVELVGYDYIDRRYFPGSTVRMTFYWHVLEQSETDNSLAIALIDPRGTRLGGIDTYPGAGTLRTSTWEAGKFYADTYEIRLTGTLQDRFPFDAQVAWYEGDPDNRATVTDADDNEIQTVLLDAGAYVTPNLSVPAANFISLLSDDEPASSRLFDTLIAVRGFIPMDDPFTVSVEWEARSDMAIDYTTFLHVLNDEGDIVAQDDVFPFFPTHYWNYSERYIIDHQLEIDDTLEPGIYSVQVGWYENLGDEFPRLVIQAGTEDERTAYDLFTFEVTDDGEFILPEPETTEEDAELEAAPEPEASAEVTSEATNNAPEVTEEATSEVTAEATDDTD